MVDGALEERALALIDPEVRPLALLHLCLQLARAHHHGHPDLLAERGLDLLIAVAGLGAGLLEDDLLRGGGRWHQVLSAVVGHDVGHLLEHFDIGPAGVQIGAVLRGVALQVEVLGPARAALAADRKLADELLTHGNGACADIVVALVTVQVANLVPLVIGRLHLAE